MARVFELKSPMSGKQKFVIEVVCCETQCIARDVVMVMDNPSRLLEIVAPSSGGFSPASKYDFGLEEAQRLAEEFNIVLPDGDFSYRLRCWHRLDKLPYKIHTNRELKMMLDGRKPLAVFSEIYPSNVDFEIIPESYFLPYVESGLFVKREYVGGLEATKVRYVLYAKFSEAWRIDAYILLRLTSEKVGWNQGFERMEGALLGYEEWQNDAYIKMIYSTKGMD